MGEGDDFMAIGGIGSIASSGSMSFQQITSSDLKDQKSKGLENDITDVQRKMQQLSSEEDMTATEKAEEKQKLQQEKSDLSTKLKLHQDELQKSQKREIKLAELQEDREPEKEDDSEADIQAAEEISAPDRADDRKLPADDRHAMQPGTIITQNSDGTVILKEVLNQAADSDSQAQQTKAVQAEAPARAENTAAAKEEKAAEDESDTETGLTGTQVQAMVSADSLMQQADRQGSLVTKTEDDIAVLKGEIKQDAYRGTDTDRKRAELQEMQEQRKREMAVQFSMMGEANRTSQAATETNTSAGGSAQIDNERTLRVSGIGASQEEQALQQGFQVSIA